MVSIWFRYVETPEHRRWAESNPPRIVLYSERDVLSGRSGSGWRPGWFVDASQAGPPRSGPRVCRQFGGEAERDLSGPGGRQPTVYSNRAYDARPSRRGRRREASRRLAGPLGDSGSRIGTSERKSLWKSRSPVAIARSRNSDAFERAAVPASSGPLGRNDPSPRG